MFFVVMVYNVSMIAKIRKIRIYLFVIAKGGLL